MALYLVTYDIRSKNKDYKPLISYLESIYGERVLQSVWMLSYPDGNAKVLATEMTRLYLDKEDSLLVQEVGKDAGWNNLETDDFGMNRLLGVARF